MGLLSWWKIKGDAGTCAAAAAAKAVRSPSAAEEVPVAVKVRRRDADPTVFEFGPMAVAPGDEFTLAGYCTVSDRLEPCRWAIVTTTSAAATAAADAPRFRIIF